MALEQRIASLQKRHSALKEQIREETAHVYPNEFLLQKLKRENLGIKDSISRLMGGQQEAA